DHNRIDGVDIEGQGRRSPEHHDDKELVYFHASIPLSFIKSCGTPRRWQDTRDFTGMTPVRGRGEGIGAPCWLRGGNQDPPQVIHDRLLEPEMNDDGDY